ncbi:CotY/CotZ family spore coat protein [Pseudalkalibacillus caeni]|uniref:Spore coat protein n=1 Tax=Exobacillus caeni TaxID=2574798 RepID=A0A5R9FB59_9BACL|nr:CotY/CotZ family spore coat protein [Pseudalkalibacillus caeni]TLS37784.1 spore coat protein [Pseudalkalibacillus caeni]
MSCGHGKTGKCVSDILRRIADVQSEVTEGCRVSCEQSIEDLVSPVAGNNLNTIPLILYCGCEPFEGFGVRRDNSGFECLSSFFFRVKSVDEHDCAVLELLEVDGMGNGNGGHGPKNPCDQFDESTEFTRTGICITADLTCFCAVSCLPAVNAVMGTTNGRPCNGNHDD